MHAMMHLYTNPKSATFEHWTAASIQASTSIGKGVAHARNLRTWSRSFIRSHEDIPINPFGLWHTSLLDDEDLAMELQLHLQSIGKYVRAQDICDYLRSPEALARWGLEKTISPATAKRWMKRLGWRWVKNFRGQYADGHEREDVVNYQQNVFIPRWMELTPRMRSWGMDGQEEARDPGRAIVVWFHDESTFYANDRWLPRWVFKDESPTPYAKGEGASLMIADFVSADYGWLRSPDGQCAARVQFKAGKGRDGYFDNSDILKQALRAMEILQKYYPDDAHILIYDNTRTHLKRADDAISARKMPKNVPREGTNWGIEVAARDQDGKPIHGRDGKVAKAKVQMTDGTFADGSPQLFYFPAGHARAGIFKGMAKIPEERGFTDASKLCAECPGFKCSGTEPLCCCRRILYNEPDFVNVKSNLETL
jgi:hypothetical protein